MSGSSNPFFVIMEKYKGTGERRRGWGALVGTRPCCLQMVQERQARRPGVRFGDNRWTHSHPPASASCTTVSHLLSHLCITRAQDQAWHLGAIQWCSEWNGSEGLDKGPRAWGRPENPVWLLWPHLCMGMFWTSHFFAYWETQLNAQQL